MVRSSQVISSKYCFELHDVLAISMGNSLFLWKKHLLWLAQFPNFIKLLKTIGHLNCVGIARVAAINLKFWVMPGIVSNLCVQTYEANEHKANAISPVHQQLIDLGLLLCTLCRSAALHSMQIEYYWNMWICSDTFHLESVLQEWQQHLVKQAGHGQQWLLWT